MNSPIETRTIQTSHGVVRVREYAPGQATWRDVLAMQRVTHNARGVPFKALVKNGGARFHGGVPSNALGRAAQNKNQQREWLRNMRALGGRR